MAISNTASRNTYTLDAVTTSFDITFDVVLDDNGDAKELEVWLIDEDGNRTEVEKGYASDQYTVSYKTVTYLDATSHAGDTLLITRATPRTQETDFVNNGAYNLNQVEAMSDKLTRIVQEQDATIEDKIQTGAEYAEAAKESAANALASEQKAYEWANKAPDVEVETGLYSAKHWAAKASVSAGAASVSAYDASVYAGQASSARGQSASYALESEGWANGEQSGVPVSSDSPYYHYNSKYWADIARQYGTGGLHYIGVWTITSQTDYSGIGTPRAKGDLFYCQGTACTIDGVTYTQGDLIIFNQDVASTITTSAIDKIDNTETVTPDNTCTLSNKTIDGDDNTIYEYKPAIGVPTLWIGTKPDWALDFGNGASTKYLWANYPKLNNSQFKDVLTTLSTAGWMSTYDGEGFYVPDLRGIVPIGYGTNGVRVDETNSGGTVGQYLASKNKYHNHGTSNRVFTGSNAFGWATFAYGDRGGLLHDAGGVVSLAIPQQRASLQLDSVNWGHQNFDINITPTGSFTLDVDNNGALGDPSKPTTIGCMWIVRFE